MISIIYPAYNEAQNIERLIIETCTHLSVMKLRGEIILVDDGSTDSTKEIAAQLAMKNRSVKLIQHKENQGKTAAFESGWRLSKGEIVFLIDSDQQHTVEDIPKFIDKMEEGYDIVNGWRVHRKDPFSKRFFSRIYNILTNFVTGLKLHDIDCGFKAFKRETLKDVVFVSDLHRYILAVLKDKGYKIGEVEVQHFPRKYGKSKYGGMRVLKGFFDLIATKMRLLFLRSPMLFFGFTGLIMMFIGFMICLYLLTIFLMTGAISPHIPLLTLGVLLLITGLQSFALGFIADAMNYHHKDLLQKLEEKKNYKRKRRQE